MGIKPPRGVLMYGPPRLSQTMIAKALANESGLNFLSIKDRSCSVSGRESGEKAVRDLFRQGSSSSTIDCIFDEL